MDVFGTYGNKKPPEARLVGGFKYLFGTRWNVLWSPRQESNLYLALRRHLFYPLNYGETRRQSIAEGKGAFQAGGGIGRRM